MYLSHFGLEQLPFHLTPDTELFLGLAPHFEAVQTLSAAIEMGKVSASSLEKSVLENHGLPHAVDALRR